MCKLFVFPLLILLSVCCNCYSGMFSGTGFSPPLSPPINPMKSWEQSYGEGYEAGVRFSSSGVWLGGGAASGFVFGLLGATVLGMSPSGNYPNFVPDDVQSEAYQAGYFYSSKQKNRKSAWLGAGLGFLAWILLAALSMGISFFQKPRLAIAAILVGAIFLLFYREKR